GPTTVACPPDSVSSVLDHVRRARETPDPRSARVLPAHLESNFVNPDMRGAQPMACLRSPRTALEGPGAGKAGGAGREEFDGADILRKIERAGADVGMVTVATAA